VEHFCHAVVCKLDRPLGIHHNDSSQRSVENDPKLLLSLQQRLLRLLAIIDVNMHSQHSIGITFGIMLHDPAVRKYPFPTAISGSLPELDIITRQLSPHISVIDGSHRLPVIGVHPLKPFCNRHMQFRRIVAEHPCIFGIDHRLSCLHVQVVNPHVACLHGETHPLFTLPERFSRPLVIGNVAGSRKGNAVVFTVAHTPRQPLYRAILAYIAVFKIIGKTSLLLPCNFVKSCLPVVRMDKFNDRPCCQLCLRIAERLREGRVCLYEAAIGVCQAHQIRRCLEEFEELLPFVLCFLEPGDIVDDPCPENGLGIYHAWQ